MSYTSIQHISKETKRRIKTMELPYEDEYRCQLKYLGFMEKAMVKETFLREEWNIGSARVLGFLQEANILSATELVLSIESEDLTQQIMNDLLETEYKLLANIIQLAYQANQYSQTLTAIVKSSFGALMAELKENPNVIPCNYLEPLKDHLQPKEMNMVKQEHFHLLLNGQECSGQDGAIGRQDSWRDEMQMFHDTILGGLIVELVSDKLYIVNMLKQRIDSADAISLKYVLNLLNVIAKTTGVNRAEGVILKEFIKSIFSMTVETGLTSKMQLLLLFAREICAANEAILGTYSEWYKQTIGEMTYVVKKAQFIRMMEMLTGMLPSETNLDILTVHLTISISAPAKCNDYVLNYKQLCRAHINQLKSPDATILVD